jgi:primary-amine oxidase
MNSPLAPRPWQLLAGALAASALVVLPGILALALRGPAPSRPAVPAAFVHPLDPLTPAEIAAAARALRARGDLSGHALFPLIVLNEPPKEIMLHYQPGQVVPREALAVIFDSAANRTYEAVVDVAAQTVRSLKTVEGAQPFIMLDELNASSGIVLGDPDVRAALGKRGITDLDKVIVNLWAPGHVGAPGTPEGTRLGRALLYYSDNGTDGYDRPIEGLVVVLNLNTRRVVQVLDTGVVPVPQRTYDFFNPGQLGPPRQAPRPLELVQPQGPSFEVRGHEVRWQKWRFRYASHQREGVVLYQVGYEDGGRLRPVLYRASLSEMLVPYAEPGGAWVWRASFDEGEYGLGQLANTLERGKQVPDNAVLLDSVFAGEQGEAYTRPASVALYERDGGVLWMHKIDYPQHLMECRRGRELVIGSLMTVGNYDYSLNWVFTQDGQIRVEVELTGILRTKGVATRTCTRCADVAGTPGGTVTPAGDDRYGTLVAPNLVASNHQHLLSFRLDLDVDGPRNTVCEMNVRAAPDDPAHPGGPPLQNAFLMAETVLATEQEAQRDLNLASHRRWKVFNPAAKNELGHYPGYVLDPAEGAVPYLAPDSPVRRQAGFINHHLWVTRYKPGEYHAAGDYPSQGKPGDGLARYVGDNEKLVNEDVVVWYTLGITHVPRPEEWPVMPVTRCGFRLVPDGFFVMNPALDVPAGPAR